MSHPETAVILVAAGAGTRMQAAGNKTWLELGGKTLIEHSLDEFAGIAWLRQRILVVRAEEQAKASARFSGKYAVELAVGGARRQDSVYAGLQRVSETAQWVLVHDAARPFFKAEALEQLAEALETGQCDGVILATPLPDTLKVVTPTLYIERTIAREQLWQAQTPQLFRHNVLRQCLERSKQSGTVLTDESQALEKYGFKVKVAQGSRSNFKLTIAEDYAIAELMSDNLRLKKSSDTGKN